MKQNSRRSFLRMRFKGSIWIKCCTGIEITDTVVCYNTWMSRKYSNVAGAW